MGNDRVVSLAAPAVVEDALTELLRTGARRLIEAAVAAEFEECLSGFADDQLPDGRRRVVRNGHLPRREILTGIGAVQVEVPKLRSRSGSSAPFRSSLVPPYVRRSASLDAAVPWLYLHGVSTGRMRQAVAALVGEESARGLSANVVSRLKRVWDEEYREWCRRDLADDWAYVWADGIHSGPRGAGERLCVLVVIGVNARGDKHFLAIEDGVRESTQSWREVLPGMKQRGFARPAKLAVGDGALGFWSALSEVYPQTRSQRCWMHKTGNVLNYLPKSSQPKAKRGLHEIWMAETRAQAEHAFDDWIERYDDKYPKATARLARDRRELLAFYDFPGVHWTHLRTTNVIESSFATIRHRSKRAKGCVSRQSMLSMIYKMGMCAEQSWRRLRGFRQLAKVIEGVKFNDGIEVVQDSRAAARTRRTPDLTIARRVEKPAAERSGHHVLRGTASATRDSGRTAKRTDWGYSTASGVA